MKVLFIGGSGRISASSVRLAAASGMDVTVVNRGTNAMRRSLPDTVRHIECDVTDEGALTSALAGHKFDAVVDFLAYDEVDVQRAVRVFGASTGQYIYISSASVYSKPLRQWPITESSSIGPNPSLGYATTKWRGEMECLKAHVESGFPVTIVRPSHTYDDSQPPLAGGWTILDRLERGAEIPVHGDGTSLWTVTHADDFALGLVGLLGNSRTIGESFHITSDDVVTWDQIYTIFADRMGVTANLVHVASEFFPLAAPDWFWSDGFVGDLGHSAVFDNTKLRRFVPSFAPKLTLERSATRMVEWRESHRDLALGEPDTDKAIDRIVEAYHAARRVFQDAAPSEGAQK